MVDVNHMIIETEDGMPSGQIAYRFTPDIVPCFTPGTRIATPRGEVLIETLRPGDRVITRDSGLQVIRWIGTRDLSGAQIRRVKHLAPIKIAKGALGNDLPERDMYLSPNHRMLVSNDKTALHFEDSEVLVAAKHLIGLRGVHSVANAPVSYIHLMLERHEVILVNGAWSESFQPGLRSLAGVGNAQRTELLEIFPELANHAGLAGYTPARRILKTHEAAEVIG